MRFSSKMLPFIGSLFLERQPIWGSFSGKRPRDVYVGISLELRLLLPEDFAVSKFKQKNWCVSFQKDLKRV